MKIHYAPVAGYSRPPADIASSTKMAIDTEHGITLSDGLDELSAAMRAAGIEHALYHDCIWMTLPQLQGHVEIKSWSHQGRTAQLSVNREWFSLNVDDGDFDGPPEAVIARVAERLSERGLSLLWSATGALK